MRDDRLAKGFLVLLVIAITVLFGAMIRDFLMVILLAAIFSGLVHPFYRRLLRLFRGRRAVAALATLVLLFFVVIIPLLGILGIVAGEALRISQAVRPWISEHLSGPVPLAGYLEKLPGWDQLAPYRETIVTKLGELVGSVGSFLFNSLSAATRGTVAFLFKFFLMLYAMFFFLLDGGPLLARILYYLPLGSADEQRMVDKFLSVTRATLKGTLLIGLTQGTLAGLAFWVVGIEGALFWGTLMTLLSIIPGIGTALVWGPAALVLLIGGHWAKGIGLVLFCTLVVGSVDNLLRPRLVGRDTQMHELLILFGTLGGVLLFGVLGFIVGPIIAALFVTVWEIYGTVFRDLLPGSAPRASDGDQVGQGERAAPGGPPGKP
jgi:predicted PurR-regulated permease PerM